MNNAIENKNGNGNGCEAYANTDAAGRANFANDLEKEREELEWNSVFNISVNEDLEKHYRLIDILCKTVIALFGTSAFTTYFVDLGDAYKICGLIVAAISVLMLSVDFAGLRERAKSQRYRYSKAYTAVKQAKNKREMDSARRLIDDISNDDLNSSEICDALAANATIDRLGRDCSFKAKVGWFKRLTRFILPWGRPKYGQRD